jgi:3-oxoacyl-[acyl-carrier protein] reductase
MHRMRHFALVTGVGHRRGIGNAVCERIAQRGDGVFVTRYGAFDAERGWASGAAADLSWPGIDADLADPGSPRRIFDAAAQAAAEFGVPCVDILINNHAFFEPDTLETLQANQLDLHLAVNVRGTVLLCQDFANRNLTGWGRIVNLTSGQSLAPMPGELSYAVSKSAIEGGTLSLSSALASRGITVNAVDPGGTQTGWMADVGDDGAADTPRGRVGLPQDAASLIEFLASDAGGWVNGQVIRSRGWV